MLMVVRTMMMIPSQHHDVCENSALVQPRASDYHGISSMGQSLVLVTGSFGLIGLEVCRYFSRQGYRIAGVDNNQRAVFLGPDGDTGGSRELLRQSIADYRHF